MTSRPPHLKISALRTLGSFQFPGTRPSPSLRDQTDDLRAVDPITGGDPHRPDHRPLRLVGSSSDSPPERAGFEPVWGFSCQVVFLGCSRFFVRSATAGVLHSEL